MDVNLVVVGVILVAAFLLCLLMWPRDNSFHRNIGALGARLILMAAIVVFVVCLFLAGNEIIRNGVGELYTDYAEITKQPQSDEDGDSLVITVNVDTIQIGSKSYANVSEVKQIIAGAVASGKHIRIIDDYAVATTYNELISAILDMNVSRSNIEEIEQP